MKDCIVCHGTGKYFYSDTGPGRGRTERPMLSWEGPCPYCKGTGKTEVTMPTRFYHYIAAGPGFIIAAGVIPMHDAQESLQWAAMWAAALT